MDVYGHLLSGLGDKLDEAPDEAHRDALSNISRPERGLTTMDRT